MENHKDSPKFKMVAKTFFGMEQILAEELKKIGAENIEIQKRAVSFEGTQSTLYQSNLWLRTAIKVLKPIHFFKVKNEKELYDEVQKIAWEQLLSWSDTFSVESTISNHPNITHSHYATLKVKDAIVDYFREKVGRRPSVNVENPQLRIHLHISGENGDISLDSSGEVLQRRGYRQEQLEAPLNESLAAALVMYSNWDGVSPLIDPFCGSGTILIEAALIAKNYAPGLLRKENFAFQKWRDFDRALWRKTIAEAERAIVPLKAKILGSDYSEKAIQIASKNISRANLEEDISLSVKSFNERMPLGNKGFIITNPPYGERIGERIEELYEELGNTLKKNFIGYEAWIISVQDALKFLGLKPYKKFDFQNGALNCKFQGFQLFEGSWADMKNP
ncbi:MAG: THUMP domain-containing protein [Flammeovirgaceae bacterium]